jgi:peptidoglycan/xylan/chitin deacetylase (PgdA/CDA1 family)
MGPGRYFERLSKALPGKGWSRGVREFWPDGAKLVISLSLQFEAGGNAEAGFCRSPFTPDEPDPCGPASWQDYGFKEGIPRLLDVFHRRRIRVTAHMTGAAVDRNPQLAREIVDQGHEAAVRGQHWSSASPVAADEERRAVEATVESIRRAAGTRAVGFHSCWLEAAPNTWEGLQDLGFLYSSDDLSRDEPFLVTVRAKPFVIVPYTLGMNDLVAYETRHFSSDQYASELKNEFEMLYTESESRRRMMSISIHDRISGRPARAKVLEEFIIYAQRRPGVVFMRKDEIARFALSSSVTPREELMKKGLEAA